MSGRHAPPTLGGGDDAPRDPRKPPRTIGADDPQPSSRTSGGAPRTQAPGDPVAVRGRAPRTIGVDAPTPDELPGLPRALQDRYEPVGEFERGGQGDVLLCLDRETGEQVVVKIFKRTIRPGADDPRTAWTSLDEAHVVKFLAIGQVGTRWWEVLEYCRFGTLRDFAQHWRGQLPTPELELVVREVTDALEYLHGLRPEHIVHRDIKPDNILVRTAEPLDLVLTDFGLAVATDVSYEFRTVANTPAYAAPESVNSGATPISIDWWSLGMTVAELAAGRHPYRLPNGEMMDPRQILAELPVRDVPLDSIPDARARLLASGLLTRDPAHRWGAKEVRAWLRGESPQVVAPQVTSKSVPRFTSDAFRAAFPTPVALAEAMRMNWGAAGSMVAGHELGELAGWVERHFPALSIADVVAGSESPGSPFVSPDRRVAELIARFDPEGDVVFQGESLDPRSLAGLGARVAAEREGRLSRVVESLFASGALRSFDAADPSLGLAAIDGRWHTLCEQTVRWFQQVPQAGSMTPTVRAMVLGAAIEETAGTP